MASKNSLGFVETYGMVAAIEAADAMVKTARVKVKTFLNADVGMISVVCEGDLAACKAAIDAGRAAADRVGKCLSANLIARPAVGIEAFNASRIGSDTALPESRIKKSKAPPSRKGPAKK
jgi:microcompartment protein CcmL/EutN